MGLFDKIKEPIFLKDHSNVKEQLAQLEAFQTNDEAIKKWIQKDIMLLKYGIAGEEKIAFELKNSHMPMYVLQDLCLEHNGLTAQLDYVIVTRGRTFILECKNLYGNIEINNAGDFIRTVKYGSRYEKEGIYSPITQNKRHIELLKAIMRDQPLNILQKAIFDKAFSELYCPVVVMANPQTVVNMKYAKKEIKEQVIRADQLIAYMKNANANALISSEKEMQEWAENLLSLHKEHSVDYTAKYKKLLAEKTVHGQDGEVKIQNEQVLLCPKCGAKMVKRKATKGSFEGKEFWGCSNYPNCKSIINIQ